VGIFSEVQAISLYHIIGIDLQLSIFPKNFEFLYPAKSLNEEITMQFFNEFNQKNRLEGLYQQFIGKDSQVEEDSEVILPQKFDGCFQFVKQNYFSSVLFEVVFSRIIFDKAKKRFFEKKQKRKELSEQLVKLQLKEIMKIFENLLEKMVEGSNIGKSIIVDALNSLEDKIICSKEKANIESELKNYPEELSKNVLIDLIIKEKAKTVEQELFAYHMDFFEKYLLENFDSFPNRKNQFVTIEGFFELLDKLPRVQISSRQKFLLWSFFSSSGLIKNNLLLDFVSFVSIIAFYIQQVLSKLSDKKILSKKDNIKETLNLQGGVLSSNQLNDLVCNNLEEFQRMLKKHFIHLKFDSQLTTKLHHHQIYKRKVQDFEGVFDELQKLHKVNHLYGDLLRKFMIY
jgi:hypothetical protein